ncbi:DUF3558 domain-containing protein [Actinomycetospora straminea]|uniref:DUF3558 domain-containing protein n=1 Tax=Actinomycetospora straminea TaxID=663607 RepID=A0ABP9ETE7_9PSEU|nr:DUF3558 domain-containing protein [Actinomycetospora straminea]MDD7933924.1 DUF3558 domain-containing protein [Actinomycetospora straminea]
MIRVVLLVVLGSLVLGACSSTRPAPTAPPAADRFGAPVPARSLDASQRASRPCAALTETQLRGLGLEPTGRLDALPTGGPACIWEDAAFTQQVSAVLYPTRDYLVDTYRARGTYQYFVPTTIAGLPAVAQQTTPGARTCTMTTGIAIGQAVDVTVNEVGVPAGARSTSCAKARNVTEAVVSNLPPAPQK